jgi:hypothetical protein
MKSAEFAHGRYTIKTIFVSGEARARAFYDGSWLREVSDWTASTLEEAVRLMRSTLDELDDEGEEVSELSALQG